MNLTAAEKLFWEWVRVAWPSLNKEQMAALKVLIKALEATP